MAARAAGERAAREKEARVLFEQETRSAFDTPFLSRLLCGMREHEKRLEHSNGAAGSGDSPQKAATADGRKSGGATSGVVP